MRAVVARRPGPLLPFDRRRATPAARRLRELLDGLYDDSIVPGARQRGACGVGADAPRLLVSPERIGLGITISISAYETERELPA